MNDEKLVSQDQMHDEAVGVRVEKSAAVLVALESLEF